MSRIRAMAMLTAGLVLVGAASIARADIQRGVTEDWPSKHEVSTHLGFQAGFGSRYGSVSGFKLEADYAYRFHPLAWFMVQIGNNFGFGSADGICANPLNGLSCYRGGWDFELMAGFKLKWAIPRIPLVVEAPVLVGVDLLYNRDCNDDGAGVPVFKTGGGVKYFITRKIGLGAKFDIAGGPAFHTAGNCGITQGYTDFFGYFDFMLGAEFVLGG